MFTRIKIGITKHFPTLSRGSRYLKAFYYSKSATLKSYSENGEDVFVWEELNKFFPSEKYSYIEVGGFHPMLLSNTYLLYRKGLTGLVIEPNRELIDLHRKFRPKDIQLELACSKSNGLNLFYLQNSFPALSSLNELQTRSRLKINYVPVLNLDTIYSSLWFKKVFFLSIDVEGYNLEVIQGGIEVLQNTFLVCVECESSQIEEKIKDCLESIGFNFLKRFGYNLVYKNKYFKK